MNEAGSLAELYLNQSSACHWIVGTDNRFVAVFGDACSFFGRSADEMVGRDIGVLPAPESASLWRGRFARVIGGETLYLRERRGQAIWNVSLFPLHVKGAVRYAAGLGSEVSSWGTAEDELRHTVLSALRAQEYERNALSRFLHDSVGQTLTALGLRLDLVRMDLDGVAPDTSKRVAEIQEIIGDVMERVREYSYALNPSAVERAGLRAALDLLVGRVRPRYAGSFRTNVDPSLKLGKTVAAALYQIAQEAVENAVQHSGCSNIEISVKSTRIGTILEIRDNGKGFDPGDIITGRRGLGLLSMEHYAAEGGLELSVLSTRGAGTTVRAVWRD